jgi:hypothetical protein
MKPNTQTQVANQLDALARRAAELAAVLPAQDSATEDMSSVTMIKMGGNS